MSIDSAKLWRGLFIVQTGLLLAAVYASGRQWVRYRDLKRPVVIQTNVVVTNVTTTVQVVTNVIVTNAAVTNLVRPTPLAKPAAAQPSRSAVGPKVLVRGYNLVPYNGVLYAHAVVQNVTGDTLKTVRIRFNEFGLSRRGKILLGSVADSTRNLGPYQFWEVRRPANARTLQIELVDVTATE